MERVSTLLSEADKLQIGLIFQRVWKNSLVKHIIDASMHVLAVIFKPFRFFIGSSHIVETKLYIKSVHNSTGEM